MIVSLFFYTQKRAVDKDYFRKRLARLLQIICFWWPVYFLLTQFTSFPLVPDSFAGVLLIPLLNGALFFLGGLIFCVLSIEFIERVIGMLPRKFVNIALILFVALGFSVSIFVRYVFSFDSVVLRQLIGLGPLTFLIYPASMVLFAHRRKSKSIPTLFGLGLAFQLLEYFLIIHKSKVNSYNVLEIFQLNYGSPLVVPLALIVLLIFVSLEMKTLNDLIGWVASHALGIYLVHPVVIACINRITNEQFLFMYGKTLSVSSGTVGINLFGVSVVAIISLSIVFVLDKSPLKRFVC